MGLGSGSGLGLVRVRVRVGRTLGAALEELLVRDVVVAHALGLQERLDVGEEHSRVVRKDLHERVRGQGHAGLLVLGDACGVFRLAVRSLVRARVRVRRVSQDQCVRLGLELGVAAS